MSSSAEFHTVYGIANAPILPFPFPHIHVRNVFPADFYAQLRAHLPPADAYRTLQSLGRVQGEYSESRRVLVLEPEAVSRLAPAQRAFWEGFSTWLLGPGLLELILSKFRPYLEQRFGNAPVQFRNEALLVHDSAQYSLGPHTDSASKVLSFLFYLPADDSHSALGTSMYLPKQADFTCDGGPHYPFDQFHHVQTMAYLPNTLFAFLKTSHSFHGVEPILTDARRDLLLYDIRVDAPTKSVPTTRFSF